VTAKIVKSSNRGSKPGERRGGRQKGTRNHKNAALVAAVEASGITPLDVMLLTMRAAWAEAEKIDDPLASLQLKAMAVDTAHKAAPYVHAKLANIELNGKDGGPLTVKVVTCG
jgi:hypothetical protein